MNVRRHFFLDELLFCGIVCHLPSDFRSLSSFKRTINNANANLFTPLHGIDVLCGCIICIVNYVNLYSLYIFVVIVILLM